MGRYCTVVMLHDASSGESFPERVIEQAGYYGRERWDNQELLADVKAALVRSEIWTEDMGLTLTRNMPLN